MSDVSRILKDIEFKIEGDNFFELLYKSEADVNVEDFHTKCDGKGPTVTILYGKYNTIYGGYTSQSWSSDKMNLKKDPYAFLFHKFDNAQAKCLFMPIKKGKVERGITCDANFGPTFGGGPLKWNYYDLQSFKKESNKSEYEQNGECLQLNGSMRVGYAYDFEKSEHVQRRKKGLDENPTVFTDLLLVRKIEVYRVIGTRDIKSWRKEPTDERIKVMKRRLGNIEVRPDLGIKHYNILLVGEIGSGKSSFFNTLATVFAEEVKVIAPTRDSTSAVTKGIYAYELKSKDGEPLKLRIFDMRGFDVDRGYHNELPHILEGRIPVGYIFPESTSSFKEDLLSTKSLNNEIHLVCFVTGNFTSVADYLRTRFEDIQETVAMKGVPMVIVATKFDVLCPKVMENADHIYKSPKASDAVKKISSFFGVTENLVLPVVNYVTEEEVNRGKDRLALQTLDVMVSVMKDCHKQSKGEWFEHQWKQQPTDEKTQVMKNRLESMEPSALGIGYYNILLVGEIGSGKSSFFNTLATVFAEEVKAIAPARASTSAVTKGVYAYELKSKDGEPLKLRIFDIRGFDADRGYDNELQHLLEGRLPVGYTASILSNITTEFKEFPERASSFKEDQLTTRSLCDVIHLVCFVTGNFTSVADYLRTRFEEIQKAVTMKGLPMVIVATKLDILCPKVMEDADNIYKSPKARDAVKKISSFFGVTENHVLPVINYVAEEEVDGGKNRLAIQALDVMVSVMNDCHTQSKGELPELQWRKQPTHEETEKMRHRLENMEVLPGLKIRQYNILLIGLIGSGKSSLYNTMATVFAGRVTSVAQARDATESVTNKVIAYEILSENDDPLIIRIIDIRGFHESRGYDNELQLLLDGKLPVGYEFPEHSGQVGKDIKLVDATLNDEIHLVCFVTGTSNLDFSSDTLHEKITDIQKTIIRKGLPMVVVATKFDTLCQKISDNADHVYKSRKAYDAVETISNYFGISKVQVFPVVNYVNDAEVQPGKDRLVLQAMEGMVTLIKDYLEHHSVSTERRAQRNDNWSKRATELHEHTNEKDAELEKLGKELAKLGEKKLHVLCFGAVHCGKSSFVDSLSSALQDELQSITSGAFAMKRDSEESMTEKMYHLKYKQKDEIKESNVYIGDIPGFQVSGGIRVDDVKYVIQGHVPNKYKIKNGIDKNSRKFKTTPQKEDRMHCVCFVYDILTPPDELPPTIQDLLTSLCQKEIPVVVVVTKADRLSDAVSESTLNVFQSKVVKERIKKLSEKFNFKQNSMFPVINYVDEDKIDPEYDVLLIAAFKKILSVGKQYLERPKDEPSDESDESEA